MPVVLGDAFWWDPRGGSNVHLYVVITLPTNEDARFVLVNLTESTGGQFAFTLTPTDDPAHITKASDVNFGDAIVTNEAKLDYCIATGMAIAAPPPFNLDLVEKIARAGKTSVAMEPTPKKLLNKYWP